MSDQPQPVKDEDDTSVKVESVIKADPTPGQDVKTEIPGVKLEPSSASTAESTAGVKRKRPVSSSSSGSSSSGSSSSGSGSSSSGSSSSGSGSSSSGSSSSGSGSSGSSSSGSSSSGSSSSGSGSSSSDDSSSGSGSSGSSSGSDDSSSGSSDDDDDDRSRKPKKVLSRKEEKKKEKREKKKSKALLGNATVHSPVGYEVKNDLIPLEPSKGANKWWSRPPMDKSDVKWVTLDHNGILFAPPYQPHGVKILYDGQPVDLTPAQEEIATFYSQALGTDHVEKEAFRRNFFNDWKQLLGPNHVIQSLAKCDFRPIREHLDKQKELLVIERKTPEYKLRVKKEKEYLDSLYGHAIVNGFKESVGNYKTEIPTLFRGRGGHPKTGKIKRRILPEDVILNIGENTPIPKCPMEGHNWKGIVHNPYVTWLAYYRDHITGSYKYIYLASSSKFKGESDRNKYNQARRLHSVIETIRKQYTRDFTDEDVRVRQRAVALYLIDFLALRVGNEKNTAEAADTVGCCSLRVEHITFKDDDVIELSFLGKDSIAYHNEVKINARVYKNLKEFCAKKSPNRDIFDRLSPTVLNDHLKGLMDGLSAKVFRTYNASITLERQLADNADKISVNSSPLEKVAFYNEANRVVAILCNHQKSVAKGHEQAMDKMSDQLKDLEEQLKALKNKKTLTFNGKKLPAPDKRDAAIIRLETRIKNHRARMMLKEDNKTVSLGTSKINYMDPRITVAWCKKYDLPIERIFNKSLLTKFPWAMEVPSTWKFTDISKGDF